MRFPIFVFLVFLASVETAHAHWGHLGELAGHAHWIGIGAVVVAGALAGIVGLLSEDDKEDADEETETPEREPV
ncbi:MAG: DUF6732 family protein [Pseudomonadota bacterium]